METNDQWSLFEHNWHMTLTMMVGSFIAGATSEGGGAVAFPVMTLFYQIPPAVARDFSMMIQAVGMTSAAVTILLVRLPILKKVIIYAGLGGFVGIPIGLHISSFLDPPVVKFFFVSLWLSFAVILYLVDRNKQYIVRTSLDLESKGPKAIMVALGILGGVVTGLLGSGLDIMIFSYLILRHRISESIGTPTSVVLMAIGSLAGVFWQTIPFGVTLDVEAIHYWLVCIPVVIFGAPIGALFISTKSRIFIKQFLILSIVIQFICAVFIIKHTITSLALGGVTACIGIIMFWKMKSMGEDLVNVS